MSDTIMSHGRLKDVRSVEHEGGIWYIARDVAMLLGYRDPKSAVRDHCSAAIVIPIQTPTGRRRVKVIREVDVQRLIMRSTLPEAEALQDCAKRC